VYTLSDRDGTIRRSGLAIKGGRDGDIGCPIFGAKTRESVIHTTVSGLGTFSNLILKCPKQLAKVAFFRTGGGGITILTDF
jgi:hypothetical protein